MFRTGSVGEMELIDTHCHLAHGRLRRGLSEALQRSREAGVIAVICAVGDLQEAKAALGLARRHGGIHCMAGVHPHDAKDADEGYLPCLEALAAEHENVAIGEIGLDYHYSFSPPDVQRRVFAEQLDLAGRLGKPIVLHTREAFDDTLAILKDCGVDGRQVVFHSWTEGPQQTRKALDLGSTISFSGIVTFKQTGELRESGRLVPDDRLLIETDAPYLSPEPVRKMKTNEPANVVHVAACLAAVRDTTVDRIAELTTANARRFFHLDTP